METPSASSGALKQALSRFVDENFSAPALRAIIRGGAKCTEDEFEQSIRGNIFHNVWSDGSKLAFINEMHCIEARSGWSGFFLRQEQTPKSRTTWEEPRCSRPRRV